MDLKIICLIKLKKYNEICYFIENFIEQAHQFGALDKRRTGKLRGRQNDFQSHSTNEWIGLNNCVKNRIINGNDN